MAFHMSVPSFTSLSYRTHSVLKTMSFRAELACPESNNGELLFTTLKVIFFLFLSLHRGVLLSPKVEVWSCHTASTLCETAVVVLLSCVCCQQRPGYCSWPRCQFGICTWFLCCLLGWISERLHDSVCDLTDFSGHKCFRRCWLLLFQRSAPLQFVVLRIYLAVMVVLAAPVIGILWQYGCALSRLHMRLHKPDTSLHGSVCRIYNLL